MRYKPSKICNRIDKYNKILKFHVRDSDFLNSCLIKIEIPGTRNDASLISHGLVTFMLTLKTQN